MTQEVSPQRTHASREHPAGGAMGCYLVWMEDYAEKHRCSKGVLPFIACLHTTTLALSLLQANPVVAS